MEQLRFGTAGIPICTETHFNTVDTLTGIQTVRKLGLECMELEFVQSVNISEKKAPEVARIAKENDVKLTCHGQYFINLCSLEQEKIDASKERILKAARIAHACGAWSMCFHAGFYMKRSTKEVYPIIKKNLQDVMKTLRDEGVNIWIRPETTGKPTQFGDLFELLKLSADIEGVMPCIDFSHLHARSGGKENTYDEFHDQLDAVEHNLGKDALRNMHIHLAGIEYSEKGEQHHLPLDDSDMNYTDLLRTWSDFHIKGCVISESPNIEDDAKKLQNSFSALTPNPLNRIMRHMDRLEDGLDPRSRHDFGE